MMVLICYSRDTNIGATVSIHVNINLTKTLSRVFYQAIVNVTGIPKT